MTKSDATKHTPLVDTPTVKDPPEKPPTESPITFNPNHLPSIVTGAHVRVGMLAPTAGPAVYNSTTGRRGSN
jgi:hypothetical protein